MPKIKKLTPRLLKRLVVEEKNRIKISSDAEEVDAKDLAHTLVNKIDYMKTLKVKESRLRRKLQEIASERQKIKKMIIKEL